MTARRVPSFRFCADVEKVRELGSLSSGSFGPNVLAGSLARSPIEQFAAQLFRIEIEDVADVLECERTLCSRSEEPLFCFAKFAALSETSRIDISSKTSQRVLQYCRHQPPQRFRRSSMALVPDLRRKYDCRLQDRVVRGESPIRLGLRCVEIERVHGG